MQKTRLFFNVRYSCDTIVSLGIISEQGDLFYAEFTDYVTNDDAFEFNEKIIGSLLCNTLTLIESNEYYYKGNSDYIFVELQRFLYKFTDYVMFTIYSPEKWVLLCKCYATLFNDKDIVDIYTQFYLKGIDSDIDIYEYSQDYLQNENLFTLPEIFCVHHNALYEAFLIKSCYEKLLTVKQIVYSKKFELDIKDLQNEGWKPLQGYAINYKVSNMGRVISLRNNDERIMKVVKVGMVALTKKKQRVEGGRDKSQTVEVKIIKLVADLFLLKPRSPLTEPYPKNHDWFDARAENIKFVSHEYLLKMRKAASNRSRYSNNKLTTKEIKNIRYILHHYKEVKQKEIAEMFKASPQTISAIKNSRNWGGVSGMEKPTFVI